MQAKVHFVCTGERYQTEIEVVASPNFLMNFDNFLADNYGVITKQVTSPEKERKSTVMNWVVSGVHPKILGDLPIHINQLKVTVSRQKGIELLFKPIIAKILPSTSQLMELNTPTDLLNSELPQLQQSYHPMRIENPSNLQEAFESRSAPQLMTAAIQTHERRQNLLLVPTVNSVQFQTENLLLDSQPTDPNSELSMQQFEIWVCQLCESPDIEITAWIDANTDRIISAGCEGPTDEAWCRNCDYETAWIGKEINAFTFEDALALARLETRHIENE